MEPIQANCIGLVFVELSISTYALAHIQVIVTTPSSRPIACWLSLPTLLPSQSDSRDTRSSRSSFPHIV